MPEWLKEVLTLYGPLGAGWPIAYWIFQKLWHQIEALQEEVRTERSKREAFVEVALRESLATIDGLRKEMAAVNAMVKQARRQRGGTS